MTSHTETTYFGTLQDAKANLRRRGATPREKQAARDVLSTYGWSAKRVAAYENKSYLVKYTIRMRRQTTQAARVVNVPALSERDARLAAAVMYPDWIILTARPASP